MFSETAGSMYEEIENARNKKLRKRKLLIRRIIAIVLLAIILIYLGLLLNDIRRFKKGDLPLINLSKETKEYDDGKVDTYYSIGWVFRYYERETIKDKEMAPIWSEIKMDGILNRVQSDQNLPEIETDYDIPENSNKSPKIEGVLFFYDKEEKLLGTYKCNLSETNCEASLSDFVEDDYYSESTMKLGYIDNRYVFITEYKNRDTKAEEKYVYLYDINAKKVIGVYQDVVYAILPKNDILATGEFEGNRFIVKKNDYYGIDEVNKGYVSNFEDYKYKFISYDNDNKLYKLKNTTNEWIAFDPIKKVYTTPIKQKVDSIYIKNDKIYIIAYEKDKDDYDKIYFLYNENGENVLTREGIDDLKAYEKFLVYTRDGYVYFIDYDGNEVIQGLKLYFTDGYTKEYNIKILDNTLIVSLPQSEDRTHLVDEYYYNMDDWSLTKTRLNVKETLED